MCPLNQDVESLGTEPPTLASSENAADESGILSDQDETHLSVPSGEDPNLGSDGTPEEMIAGEPEFDRGEIDLKEQMDRTMARMDAVNHHPRDPNITPHSRTGQVNVTQVVQNSLNNRGDEKAVPAEKTSKGHETNGYTDVGAGRSGVTRSRH